MFEGEGKGCDPCFVLLLWCEMSKVKVGNSADDRFGVCRKDNGCVTAPSCSARRSPVAHCPSSSSSSLDGPTNRQVSV